MEKIRVILDWTPDAKHSIIWAAQRNRYFQEKGISVEMVAPPSKSAKSLEMIHQGRAEIAINYPHNILLMREDLPRLLCLGALVKKNSQGLLSLQEKKIVLPADLKGKRLGIGPSPVSRGQFEVFLSSNDLSVKDLIVRTVGFEGEELLLADEIDALDAVQYAITRTIGKGRKVNFIPYTRFGVPDSPFLVFISTDLWADERRELVKGFFSSLIKGLSLVKTWTPGEWKEYTDTVPGRTPEEEMKIWEATLPLIDDGGKLFANNITELEKLQRILFQKGVLKKEYICKKIFLNP